MDINHLHLHVRDLQRSRAFYEKYFGFRDKTYHGPILFMTNTQGFDLALAPSSEASQFPPWFHYGSRLDSARNVAELHARFLEAQPDAIEHAIETYDDFVFFRVRDPDGHLIEVYWE